MRWLLSLAVVAACGGDREIELVVTVAAPAPASAGCPLSSSYAIDERFRITAAAMRSASGALFSAGPALESGIDDGELGPEQLAVALSSQLGDEVTVMVLVIVRRTGDICAPPTGKTVDATAIAPGRTEVIATGVSPPAVISPVDAQTAALSVSVTGETSAGRKIRTPAFVLPTR